MQKPIINDKVYLPVDMVEVRDLKRHYEQRMYDETACAKCPNLVNRFDDTCAVCPSYQGDLRLWGEKEINGKDYYYVPKGHLKRVEKLFDISLANAIDKRASPKMRHPLKFIRKLYKGETYIDQGVERKRPDQQLIVDTWLKKSLGIIRARPRTGKTVMAVYITCKLGYKTLIIAHQEKLLKQFLLTFEGGTKAGEEVPAFTNVNELRKKYKRPIVGIAKKMEDIDGLDVCLINYQKFISKYGAGRVKKYLKNKWGLLIGDEVHRGGALAYLKFLNAQNTKHSLGLSATTKRKDGKHTLVRDVIGPVTAESYANALTPEITIWETGITSKSNYVYRSWHGFVKHIYTSEDRNKLIVRQIFKDFKAGHKVIIVPVDQKKHIYTLQKMIDKQASVRRIKLQEDWPKDLAIPFHAGLDEDAIFKRVDSGKYTVLLPIRSMIKEGVDMSMPSMLYTAVPLSGKAGVGSPFFDQLANRVATPSKIKPRAPEIRLMVDNLPISVACFKGLFKHEIEPKLANKGKVEKAYHMSQETKDRAYEILSKKVYVPMLAGTTKEKKPKKRMSW